MRKRQWIPHHQWVEVQARCRHHCKTSVSRLAVRSLILLCQMEGKPLLGHDRACSMENFIAVVATCSREPGHLEKHVFAEQNQILEWGGGNQIEVPFSWAKSMEHCSDTERDCFKESAACMDRSCFILWTLASTCSWITSPGYSKHCWRMSSLRGSETSGGRIFYFCNRSGVS